MAKIKDLTPNKFNPRIMTAKKLETLKRSIEVFGDLGGIVFNAQTNELVSAHQRSSVMPSDSPITIEKKFDPPTLAGTTKLGFVEINGERFSYREVYWDKKKQTEALLASNKHSGEWDKENLRILFADFPDLDVELTGFDIPELKSMDITFKPTEIKEIETDAQYLRNETKSEMEIDRERFPSNTVYEKNPNPVIPDVKEIDPLEHEADKLMSPFEKVDEKTTVDGKRIVLIIDCDTEEVKQELKKKLKSLVEEAKARFF